MQQCYNSKITYFIICFLVLSATKTNAQTTLSPFGIPSFQTQYNTILFPFFLDKNQNYKVCYFVPYSYFFLEKTNYSCMISKKEEDEKNAKLKYLKCTQPDKARIEAQKAVEEKYRQKIK